MVTVSRFFRSPPTDLLLAGVIAVSGICGCIRNRTAPVMASPPSSSRYIPEPTPQYEYAPPRRGTEPHGIEPVPAGPQQKFGPRLAPGLGPHQDGETDFDAGDDATDDGKTAPGTAGKKPNKPTMRDKFAGYFGKAPAATTAKAKTGQAPSRNASTTKNSAQTARRTGDNDKVAQNSSNRADRSIELNPVYRRQQLANAQPVRLKSAPENNQYADEDRPVASGHQYDQNVNARPVAMSSDRSGWQITTMGTPPVSPAPVTTVRQRIDESSGLPMWPPVADRQVNAGRQSSTASADRNAIPIWNNNPSVQNTNSDRFYKMRETEEQAVSEPSRMPVPPALQQTPSGWDLDARRKKQQSLTIPRIAICREVRSYEDVTEMNAQDLKPGQPILIYAALSNYQSSPTPGGYRTLTRSQLEVRSRSGELIARHPLGEATDVSGSPRSNYFITHAVKIPEDLAAGNYVFCLSVHDLIGQQSSQSQIDVQVTGDRNRPGETGGIAGSETRPASFRR